MAPSLSSASRLVAAFSESASLLINRRGYAASSAMSRAVVAEEKAAVIRKNSVEGLEDTPSSSWVPDPVTGYYRPTNRAREIDPVELREMLLSNRSQP